MISTIKHFSLNCNETNRHWLDAIIDPAAHRESDLLAFEMAIERSHPGAVMTGYNKVNGEYAGGNSVLIEEVLKGAWDYSGWVMSDWGATPSWEFALKGLDQESGAQVDVAFWGGEAFSEPLRAAYAEGKLPRERLSEMVRRILRSMFAVGIDSWDATPEIDMAGHGEVALETARQGIVLLKNAGALPLAPDTSAGIAVIGGHAQVGVPTGCGSSAVIPPGGYAEVITVGGPGVMASWRNLYLLPSSPLAELKKLLPNASVEFDPGMTPAEAAMTAARADVVIVFGIRVEGEGFDNPDLSLPWGQDAVIDAVAAANPNTIVVLETGNPVSMPWHDKVERDRSGVVPGPGRRQSDRRDPRRDSEPLRASPDHLSAEPRADPPPRTARPRHAVGHADDDRVHRGRRGRLPLARQDRCRALVRVSARLSYTTFAYGDLEVDGGETVTATFTVTNSGGRRGAAVPQTYLISAPDDRRCRLIGFERVELDPGESRTVSVTADPRLLARFDHVTPAGGASPGERINWPSARRPDPGS